jgi:hypothetical protein
MISPMWCRNRLLIIGAVFLFGILWYQVVSAGSNGAIDAALRTLVKVGPLPTFTYALVDLNDDGILDAVVLINDPRYCGSGGCTLVVLTGTAIGFDVVSSSTVTWGPISVLSAKRYQWHTLAVHVAGGGVSPAVVLLPFDGHRYPWNPTLQPIASPEDLVGATILNLVQ